MTFYQEVRAVAEEKRTQSSSEDQGHQFHSLKAEFGQTPESESLYSLFESFKEMAKKPISQHKDQLMSISA